MIQYEKAEYLQQDGVCRYAGCNEKVFNIKKSHAHPFRRYCKYHCNKIKAREEEWRKIMKERPKGYYNNNYVENIAYGRKSQYF